MPLSQKDVELVLNQAGKNYKSLKDRQKDSSYFNTGEQQEEKRRAFLDSHVQVFDVYIKKYDQDKQAVRLDASAKELARDIIKEFPGSSTAERLSSIEFGLGIFINDSNSGRKKAPEQKTRSYDRHRRVRENFIRRQNKETIRNNDDDIYDVDTADLTEDTKNFGKGLTSTQIRAVRMACFWLYNNSKEHLKLVDSIAARSPREKLLIFYIVENEKQHNIEMQDVFRSQFYVPNVRHFVEKVTYTKSWFKNGKVNWDLLSDAAVSAFRLRDMLGVIGTSMNVSEEKNKDDKSGVMRKNSRPGGMREENEPGGMREENEPRGMREENEPRGMREADESFGMREENESDDMSDEIPMIKELNSRLDDIVATCKELEEEIKKNTDPQYIETISGVLEEQLKNIENLLDEDRLLRELQDTIPANTDAFPIRFNTGAQKYSMVMGFARQIVGAGSSFMSDAKAEDWTFLGQNEITTTLSFAGFALDAPLAALSFLNGIVQLANLCKSFSATTWSEIVSKFGGFLSSIGGSLKGGLAAAYTGAGLFSSVDWGSSGSGAASTTIKSILGYAGVGLGAFSMVNGGYNVINTGSQKSDLTSARKNLQDAQGEEEVNKTKKEREKQAGIDDMIMNTIGATRNAKDRQQLSAGIQVVQGYMTAAAGYTTLTAGASFGLTGIIALGFSGAALALGITKVVLEKYSKKREVDEVIDVYIGMDGLIKDYLKHTLWPLTPRQREQWKKKMGKEKDIRNKLRDEAVAYIGYSSKQKMYNEIMYQYAETIHSTLFYKNGNKAQPAGHDDVFDDENKVKDKRRYSCMEVINSLGLEVKFGGDGVEPSPDVTKIYKKLIS